MISTTFGRGAARVHRGDSSSLATCAERVEPSGLLIQLSATITARQRTTTLGYMAFNSVEIARACLFRMPGATPSAFIGAGAGQQIIRARNDGQSDSPAVLTIGG